MKKMNSHDEILKGGEQTWKEEVRNQMKQIQTVKSTIPRCEEDLIRRREDELRHAEDIRKLYERKLECTNNLYMELTTVLIQLEQRERDIIKYVENAVLRREIQSGCKPVKKRLVHPLLRAHERLPRRRNLLTQQASNSPATTAPPSPSTGRVLQSPVRATLVTQLNNMNQPETVVVPNSSFKQKKYRHRRVGSGCGVSSSPRSSPNRERRSTISTARVVDCQTQTEPISLREAISKFETICLNEAERQARELEPEPHNGNTLLDSKDSLDSILNDNDQLRDCSDDDNLKSLGRKVSEIVNANRMVSNMDNGNGNDLIPPHSMEVLETDTTLTGSNNGVVDTRITEDIDQGNESWSDEEGEEDPGYAYNYSLGRRSIARRPIGPGCRLKRSKQTVPKIEGALASDEENTSEYSYSPSSQSSTLESNPDVQRALRNIQQNKKRKEVDYVSDSSSQSESDEASETTIASRRAKTDLKVESTV